MSDKQSCEQTARDIMERCGDEDAQSRTAGDVCELANLLVEVERLRAEQNRVCKWVDSDLYGGFNTGCGRWWACPYGGTIEQNEMRWCPFCGGKLEVSDEVQG